ncbi:hypothetical protein TYRP_001735 [Tyrophagus putrescentiae]|nr:hypothetical protein TYRP_001735 [Tyrophagus putrescentiae]
MSDNSGNNQPKQRSNLPIEHPLTEPSAARDSGNESLLPYSFAAPSSSSSSSANMGDNNNKQAATAADTLPSSSSYLLLPDFIDKSPTTWIIDSDFAKGHIDKLFAAIVNAFTTCDRHHHRHPDHYQHWLSAANGSSDQTSSSAINSSLDGRIQQLPKLNPTSVERKHQSQPQAQAFSFNSEFVNKFHHSSGVNSSIADAPSRAEAITSSPFRLSQLKDEQKKDPETLVINGLLNFGLVEMQPSVRIICITEHKSDRHLASGTLCRKVLDPGGGL